MENGVLLENRRWERQIWVSGSWQKGSGKDLIVVSPGSGDALALAGQAAPEDVASVVSGARQAYVAWSKSTGEERALILEQAATILRESLNEIAWWLVQETGSIRSRAEAGVRHAAERLIASAGTARLAGQEVVLETAKVGERNVAQRVPYGVVGVITPWNSPLVLAVRSVAPALATGNAVVLKPDPHTPVSGGVVLARVFEEAGLPAGLLQVIAGGADVGESLVADSGVDKISFTGSTRAGHRVGMLAGEALKSVSLELGGNNALIVLDDADVDAAVNAGANGSFGHQGQICMATGRHIVHADVAKSYISKLTRIAEGMRVGDPGMGNIDLGPLISESQADRVENLVNESVSGGAIIKAGAKREGRFYWPTVLCEVDISMPVFTEEIFGPVAPIVVVRSEEEAVQLANLTSYGLVASVFTSNVDRGIDVLNQLRIGAGHVNDRTVKSDPRAPFGGMGCSGNGARYGVVTDLETFSTWRWHTVSRSEFAPNSDGDL